MIEFKGVTYVQSGVFLDNSRINYAKSIIYFFLNHLYVFLEIL